MAVSNDPRDIAAHDPHLAKLMAAAGDEQPPAALDAAILAAARREVSARPQTAGGGGTAAPAVRGKRNWYVPVSIAAVLVLSVSLVTLVYEEKGDELTQPVASAPGVVTTPKSSPEPASAPAAAPAPAAEQARSAPRDNLQASPTVPEKKRAEPVHGQMAKTESRSAGPPGRAQTEAAATLSDSVAKPNIPPPAAVLAPAPAQQAEAPASRPSSPAPSVPRPGAAVGGAVPAESEPMPRLLAKERRPEPFPSASEREAPAVAAREAARQRLESDTAPARDAAAPPAAVAAAPPPAPATAEPQLRTAPSMAQGRIAAAPPAPMVAARPAPKRAEVQVVPRPAWLIELDHQPPEKWLERLAEFKRDGRVSEAEALLVEFQRRFPAHPASAR